MLAVATALAFLLLQVQAQPSLERPPDISVFSSYHPVLPPSLTPPPKTITITGHVVLYNSGLMNQTAQMDLFIKVDGKDEFLRLAYTPYGGGFDAPAPSREMIPPRKMIRDGRVRWTFQVYPSGTESESRVCASLPKAAVPDGKGHYVTSENLGAYLHVPGTRWHIFSELHSIPCRYVKSWSRFGDSPGRNQRH